MQLRRAGLFDLAAAFVGRPARHDWLHSEPAATACHRASHRARTNAATISECPPIHHHHFALL
jgi:hypothetical protein